MKFKKEAAVCGAAEHVHISENLDFADYVFVNWHIWECFPV
jgi:hypothetical protein